MNFYLNKNILASLNLNPIRKNQTLLGVALDLPQIFPKNPIQRTQHPTSAPNPNIHTTSLKKFLLFIIFFLTSQSSYY